MLPVPPLVEVTACDVLLRDPTVVPVTFTVSVQLLAVATVPPESEMLAEPAAAVAVPLQVLANPLGVATTTPEGNVSLKARPVCATVLAEGLVMVNVSALLAYAPIDVGLNASLIEGAKTMAIEGLEVTVVV